MKNQTGKYFKYAIGEILLVMIGILLALQVNNWNTANNDERNIKIYTLSLANDLKEDIEQTEIRIKRIKKQISYIDSTANYIRNKSIEEINNLDALYEFNLYYGYKPFNWRTSIIEEVKNSGSLKLIKNDSLRQKIIDYYSFTQHLNQDYKDDIDLANQLFYSQSKILNTNYPNRKVFLDSLRTYYSKGSLEWRNSETYKQAEQLNLKLLTNNINDIHALINLLFQYQVQLNIRAKNEFPRLIKNAKEIIALIESEYQKS